MKEIPLTKGQVALVDDSDYDFLMQWKWHVVRGVYTDYAARKDSKRPTQKYIMHRVLLGLTDPKIKGDHRDHNGLNNQRYNLRVATQSQNMANRRVMKNASSQYLGVFRKIKRQGDKTYQWWEAAIGKDNKNIYIGCFKTEEDAARAYDEAAKKYHGEFAYLNFPVQIPT